jgi:predicted Rossmann fold flavoprotein
VLFRSDVLFTHTGISGPGILDRSRDVRPGDIVRLSFVNPALHDGVSDSFKKLAGARGTSQVKSLVSQYQIPERLIQKILKTAGIPSDLTCAHLSAPVRSSLAGCLTGFPLEVDAVGDFSIAMVTRGGITLDEVNQKTMESRIVKNLYFAGEVLDIDGDTGGYNIQSAFSTGMLAAQSIGKKHSRVKKQVS